MKAVVLEIKDGYAAVLSEDGQFIKIKDENYTPGMELTLEARAETKIDAKPAAGTEAGSAKESGKLISFGSKRIWQSAAAVAAALLIFAGVKDFNTPYGTVSLDVNPSIEISINRYDRVLDIEAVNEAATEIVEELNASGLKYKALDEAVDEALDSFSEGDYAADDGTTYVMMSANTQSPKHSEKLTKKLKKTCKEHENISGQAIAADDELLERAREHGTTAGKLYLVESLRDASGEEDFDENDWIKKPVKEIMHEIEDKKKDKKEDKPSKAPAKK